MGVNLHEILMSNYIRPEIKEVRGRKWVLNGDKNDFYKTIIDAYNGSPTNSAIIDSYSRFIYGKGLTSKDKITKAQEWAMVMSIFSKNDVRKICKDFELFGEASIEVKYLNNKVAKCYHIAKEKVVPEVANEDGDIVAYYNCYDFSNTNKYKPVRYDAFGYGSGSGERSEIYVIRDYQVGQFYFANPSYVSGLSWAKFEEEFQNYCINHIQNGLSFGYIINLNGGVQGSDIEVESAIKTLKEKASGSNRAGRFIVNQNDSKDSEMTITAMEVSEAHKQYEYLSEESRQQLMTAHKLTSPLIVGVKEASGFSSNAEELKVAFEELMVNVIVPKQESILDAFMEIIAVNNVSINLEFESLRSEPVIVTPTTLKTNLSNEAEQLFLSECADGLIELGETINEEEWEEIDCIPVKSELPITELSIQMARTFSSFPNATSEQDTDLFKVRYSYAGDSTGQREFCKKLIQADKVYRKEDIVLAETKVVNKGLGANGADTYSIWLYKGGVNCKHFWQRKIYLKRNNNSISVNEARKMILDLDPKDRPKAKWQENDPLVAQPAQPSNNNFKLN